MSSRPTVRRPLLRSDVAQLGRTSLLGATYVIVLTGMASASGVTSIGPLLLALLSATAFHAAVYQWNDLVDLPIDRTDPRRADSPLVRGTVAPRTILIASGLSATTALVVAASTGAESLLAMAIALALLGVYDLWGKRTRVPQLTDLIQGIGWAALGWFGAAVRSDATATTLWFGVFLAVSMLLVNGVLGGIRDLANDTACGARTTAIAMGASVGPNGSSVLPRSLVVYAHVMHATSVLALGVGIAVTSWSTVRLTTLVACGIVGAMFLGSILRNADDRPVALRAGFAYLVLMLLAPCLLVWDGIDGLLGVTLVTLFFVPWLCSTWFRGTVRELLARRRPTGVGMIER